jgi:bifunctional non-homologous end joining protein LigD
MLASAVDALPRGAGWAYEFKWDGVRALLDAAEAGVRIHSRNGNDVSAAYPEVVALGAAAGDAMLDGEIVALRDRRPCFELLQSRMHVRSAAEARRLSTVTPVTFVAFDLVRRYGVDLTSRAYVERRATLERWIADHPAWTLSPFFDDGAATEAAAREHGFEGVVAKRLASPYRPGTRGTDWQKLRFVRSGDFVVLGWEAAPSRPQDLSSLVLGCYRGDGLTYAGKVGSGLDERTASELRRVVVDRPDCPLALAPPADSGRPLHWVEPVVVVEVRFSAWTAEGRLRHPVFLRVRGDKAARDAAGDA